MSIKLPIFYFLFLTSAYCQEIKIKTTDFSFTPCLNEFEEGKQRKTRIISFSREKGLTTIEMSIKANCEGIHNIRYFTKKDTLFIKFDQGKLVADSMEQIVEVASCDCCYQLTLRFTDLKKTNYKVRLNNVPIELSQFDFERCQESFTTFNGENINRIDEYCRKVGRWLVGQNDTTTFWRVYEDNGVSQYYSQITTDTLGNLKSELIYDIDGPVVYTEYFNGKKWYMECHYKTMEDFKLGANADCKTYLIDK